MEKGQSKGQTQQMQKEISFKWSTVYYLHLNDSIGLKQCGLRLGIKYKGIPAQSHHTVMTLRIQRQKQIGYKRLNIDKCSELWNWHQQQTHHWVCLPLNPCDVVISNVYQVIQLMDVEFIVLDDLPCSLIHLMRQDIKCYQQFFSTACCTFWIWQKSTDFLQFSPCAASPGVGGTCPGNRWKSSAPLKECPPCASEADTPPLPCTTRPAAGRLWAQTSTTSILTQIQHQTNWEKSLNLKHEWLLHHAVMLIGF